MSLPDGLSCTDCVYADLVATAEPCGSCKHGAGGPSSDVDNFQAPRAVAVPASDPAHPLPDSNPKTAFGVQKTPLHLIPPPALEAMAGAFKLGAAKYGPYNWRQKEVAVTVYQAAALRHMMLAFEGEDIDPESGALHWGHAMACLAILVDAKRHGKLIDDRPVIFR